MFELMADTNLKWHSQSVLSVEYLCVQGTLQQEEDRYSLSKPAVSRPYWCPCHHQLTDWLLDEPSPWLMWQTIGLMSQPPALPHPLPLSHSRTQLICWVWVALCVFPATTPETDFKTFRVGFYPTAQLVSLVDWYNWSCDEGACCPKRHFVDGFKRQHSP